jgi:hypothetical protein
MKRSLSRERHRLELEAGFGDAGLSGLVNSLSERPRTLSEDSRMTRNPGARIAASILPILVALPSIAHAQGPDRPPARGEAMQPDPAWKPLGKSLWFDPAGKRLVIRTRVVQRDVPLEHFLCLKGSKDHESILATDAPARQIHAGLLLTGAVPGHPVRFTPKFEPPAGTSLSLEVQWKQNGQVQRSDARRWVRDLKTKASLAESWVFAGSELYQDPVTKRTIYAADEGDLITVANFGSAILDLPLASSADDDARMFVADPDRVPAIGTEVFLFLEPRREAKPRPGAAEQ